MIRLINLSLQCGGKPLLKQANLTLNKGQHIGLVGRNGVGKTSLFHLLTGNLLPDAGQLQRPSKLRIAHMSQEISNVSGGAIDHVLDGDIHLRCIEAEINAAHSSNDGQMMAHAYQRYEQHGGYTALYRAQKLLLGLGFDQSQWTLPVATFSGGWRVRLNLARTLMYPSDLLMLDEPTNHLDLDAIVWLEHWLQQYDGTLLLISHDRDFLNQVVRHIVHLDQLNLKTYQGNYCAFERQRTKYMAQQQAMHDKQQATVAHIESYIHRFRAKASKAKQAQSRIKALQRLAVIAPAYADSPYHFRFMDAPRTNTNLLRLEQARLGYPTHLLNADISLLNDCRYGLLGANGSGKSTLMKTLVGDLPLLAGQLYRGEHLRIGYFAQHQLEALDTKADAMLHLRRLAPESSEQKIRNFLGRFGWSGEEVFAPVSHFSGGEKVRLALALIAWQHPNLLLLDEPTNHLDMEARHALIEALQEYQGALVIISHDRHLLHQVVDHYWLVADGRVCEFDGDLETYQAGLTHRQQPSIQQQSPPPQRQQEKREQAIRRKRLSPYKRQLATLEQELESVELQLDQIEQRLTHVDLYQPDNKQNLRKLLQQQMQCNCIKAELEEQWLQQQESLEILEQQDN